MQLEKECGVILVWDTSVGNR